MPSPGLAQPAGDGHGQEGFWAQGRGRGNSEKAAWTGGGGQSGRLDSRNCRLGVPSNGGQKGAVRLEVSRRHHTGSQLALWVPECWTWPKGSGEPLRILGRGGPWSSFPAPQAPCYCRAETRGYRYLLRTLS